MIRLKSLVARPMARVRLICVPFAGAGAVAFRPWAKLLPAHVEAFAVQLPGREDAIAQVPLTDWHTMRAELIDAVSTLPPLPTAIFGHSLGAVIGLELARWLQRAAPGYLLHLFVSGRPWPGRETSPTSGGAEQSDTELMRSLDERYGSLATSLSHPEIRAVAMQALRADLQLLDSYRYIPMAPLGCPLTAFSGSLDPTTTLDDMNAWRAESTGPFQLLEMQGDHFFIESQRTIVVSHVASRL
ncbi:MAG: thioesterase [Gammaproteobacteria bacterium HGW-Gammaproteobacteria-4]|jgi:surfactin synthase thioesterase subunit|nr:MAG: thioesterase [Gammaproteobacteria bacterium HGW-Gammaproteobacteria-4]